MIKSIVLCASTMFFTSLSVFGQNETVLPLIDLQSNYRGCCIPVMPVEQLPTSYSMTIEKEGSMSEDALDITDPEISGLMASPNPTKGHLSVSVPASLIGYEITVLDMTGRFIGTPRQITGTTENLNIEGESGVYLIVIRTEKEMITERIILDTH